MNLNPGLCPTSLFPGPATDGVLSMCVSRRPCTYPSHCSHAAVVKSIKERLWMNFPCERWWLPSVSARSAWPPRTGWNNCASLRCEASSREWLFCCMLSSGSTSRDVNCTLFLLKACVSKEKDCHSTVGWSGVEYLLQFNLHNFFSLS